MPAMALDYLSTISGALIRSGALPGASQDLTHRILRDLPSDIGAYLATCKEEVPMYFTAPVVPPSPVVPQRGEPGYDRYFLGHLAELAGPLVAPVPVSTPPQVSGTSGSGAVPPATIARENGKAFIDNLERIAIGACRVV